MIMRERPLAKLTEPESYGKRHGLRPDTPLKGWVINFVYNDGGMGDFINYTVATRWLAKNAPWVKGRIFAPKYLCDFVKLTHAEFPDWQVFPSEKLKQHLESGTALIGPNIKVDGINVSAQLLNCLGAHPIDVGFAYYAGLCPAPRDAMLPMLDLPDADLKLEVKLLNSNYCVIPTGNSAPARRVLGGHINPIIRHVKDLGLTPVFLGKSDLLMDGKVTSTFPEDIAYNQGLDLREQTTVLEAACIMQHAKFTVGLDCGLLHLASVMKDSKVIFGYNVTSVEHREPRRNWGKTINISLSRKDLACIECQSTLKQMPVHTFDRCIYGDTLCIDMLFKNRAKLWCDAIDQIMWGS